jgi:nitrogen fixation protein FixH
MSGQARLAGGLQGRHVLLALTAFFGVMLVANGIFVYYALHTFAGGDTTDPYRKGMHYNQTLAEAARQDGLGWRGELVYAAAPGKTGELALRLTDKDGQPVSGLHLGATLSRPATDREDFQVSFSESAAGRYATTLRLAPGQWVVELQSQDLSRLGDPLYRLKQRIFVAESP